MAGAIASALLAVALSSAWRPARADTIGARLPEAAVLRACLASETAKPDALVPAASKHGRARSRVIDVTTIGAVPGDGRDDSPALARIPAGVTAQFPPGVYDISLPIVLRSGTTYAGAGTLKRMKAAPAPVMSGMQVDDVIVEGLTFRGGGILLGRGSRNVRIAGNRFTDIAYAKAKFGFETGIFVNGRLSDSEIAGNVFERIGFADGKKTSEHGAGIQAYHLENVSIRANIFRDVHQGISIILESRPHTGRDIRVAGNAVINPLRMGIELWGKGMTNAVVEGNCVRMRRSGDQDVGFSIVADGEGSVIEGNLAIQLHPAGAECAGIGIEVAGRKAVVRSNTVAGNWCSSIGTYNEKGWSADIEGNEICGHRSSHGAIDFSGGQGSSTVAANQMQAACPEDLIVPLP